MRSVVMSCLLVVVLLGMTGCGEKEKTESDAAAVAEAPEMGLHEAALTGNVEVIRQHILAKSDLNARDPFGSTPLIVAATFGQTRAAKVLIDGGAGLNEVNSDGATALHSAAFLCRTEIVAALLQAGADQSIQDKYGSTPLQAVAGPFEEVKDTYDAIGSALAPFGLQLDYKRIEATRPEIAAMLE